MNPVHRMYTYNTGDAPGIGLEKEYTALWELEVSSLDHLKQYESLLHATFQDQRKRQVKSGLWTEWFTVSVEAVREFLHTQPYILRELSGTEIVAIHRNAERVPSIQGHDNETQLTNLFEKFCNVFLPRKVPRRIQAELWKTFSELCQTPDIQKYRGIVQWPTGTGKTIAMLILIVLLKDWYSQQGLIYRGLLVSPKNDIFDTIKIHFKGLKEFGITLVDGSNANLSKVIIPIDTHILIFACHASLVNTETLNKLPTIGHVHYDEVHRIGGDTFFGLLKEKMNEWNKTVLTGTSATPLTSSEEQRRKLQELFGDPLRVLHSCTIDQAVREKWIAKPQFNICCLPKVNRKLLLQLFAESVVKAIQEKGNSYKHIAYVRDSVEDVLTCYTHIHALHPELKLYHAIEGGDRNDKEFQEVAPSKTNPALLFACQRYLEGSDIAGLESTAVLIGDTVSAHTILQIVGRALRLDYPEKVGICTIAKPVDEGITEDDVLESIVLSIVDILGIDQSTLDKKDRIRTIVETYISDVAIHGRRLSIGETIERIQAAYLRRVFTQRTTKEKYSTLQQCNRDLGLKSKLEYTDAVDRHPYYVENPQKVFNESWISWYDFLGIDTTQYPKTKGEFIEICKHLGLTDEKVYRIKRPERLPERPIDMYADWTNWAQEFNLDMDCIW